MGIVSSMQSGVFRIPYVGVAFFTKVLQFYFAAHPVSSRNGFLPIIADRWIMRAVYNDMTDCSDIELRDSVFALDHGNVFIIHPLYRVFQQTM